MSVTCEELAEDSRKIPLLMPDRGVEKGDLTSEQLRPSPGTVGDVPTHASGVYSVFKPSMSQALTWGWAPVRVKKTRQIKIIEPRF
jgi:hypothetical protein